MSYMFLLYSSFVVFLEVEEKGKGRGRSLSSTRLERLPFVFFVHQKRSVADSWAPSNYNLLVDSDARVVASEQRRLARMSERERETTCFACRQKGHSARDCPNALEGDLLVDGVRTMTGKDTVNICYR